MGLIATIKNLFGIKSEGDRYLVCQDCQRRFVFDVGEQQFFKSKGFTDPKRCPRCRKKVKVRLSRRGRRDHRRHHRHRPHPRHDSIIDGNSPYLDE